MLVTNDISSSLNETKLEVMDMLELINNKLGSETHIMTLNALHGAITMLQNKHWYESLHQDVKICLLEGIHNNLSDAASAIIQERYPIQHTNKPEENREFDEMTINLDMLSDLLNDKKNILRETFYPEDWKALDYGSSVEVDSPLLSGEGAEAMIRSVITTLIEKKYFSLAHSIIYGLALNAADDSILEDLTVDGATITTATRAKKELLFDLWDIDQDNEQLLQIAINEVSRGYSLLDFGDLVQSLSKTTFEGSNALLQSLGSTTQHPNPGARISN